MNIWRVPYPKFGNGPGLARVKGVAEKLGVNLARFGESGCAIVGSNGKGSTAAMTAALLEEAGASVGLFTSPHLFALNERFRLNGEDVSDDELGRHWERVAEAAKAAGEADALSGFEFLFLIAADWFASRGAAHTVWEAGIGGRLDPVRLIGARRLALTSLDLEHTELLGSTLNEIARDKLDAAPEGASVFAPRSIAALGAIKAHCAARALELVLTDPAKAAPLGGVHQQENAALAIALARDVVSLGDDDILRGLARTRWPGRLEVIGEAPLIVIDVGHTPAGVAAALDGFANMSAGRDAVLVCGASADKDAAAIVGALAGRFSTIICASALHKGARAAEIAAHASATNPQAELILAESVSEARRLALSKAGADGAVFVAGGLFLAVEFKAAHIGRDPASLAFF